MRTLLLSGKRSDSVVTMASASGYSRSAIEARARPVMAWISSGRSASAVVNAALASRGRASPSRALAAALRRPELNGASCCRASMASVPASVSPEYIRYCARRRCAVA
ncbi:Uncharacterised protein [Bordetella pertussis]|nr:Uncharacterised protein [Bordetella pertussis]